MKRRDKQEFVIKPQYPGGKLALQKFIQENLIYPKLALEKEIEGTVYISYRVDFDGKVVDIKNNKGIGNGCDEEAMRVVGLLKFAPQNNHGVKVSSEQKINIHFKLPVKQSLPNNSVDIKVNYSVQVAIPKKAKIEINKKPPQPIISYTIKLG